MNMYECSHCSIGNILCSDDTLLLKPVQKSSGPEVEESFLGCGTNRSRITTSEILLEGLLVYRPWSDDSRHVNLYYNYSEILSFCIIYNIILYYIGQAGLHEIKLNTRLLATLNAFFLPHHTLTIFRLGWSRMQKSSPYMKQSSTNRAG